MIRKILIPVLAIVGILFAVYTVRAGAKQTPPAPPVDEPASAPFKAYVAGAGIVEPSSENIAIGAAIPGLVLQVHVKPGQKVKAGEPLFLVDDRSVRADLAVKQAALESARQSLVKLQSLPRAEDIPVARARVSEAETLLNDAKDQLELWSNIEDKRAVSTDDLSRRRFAVQAGESRLVEAQSSLALLQAGAWKPDLAIAQVAVQAAEAQVQSTQVELDRMTVRAPVDAEVLKINIRAGEFAPAGVLADPLMILGATETLHVRVNVDENDAWRVKANSPAEAFVRGNSALKTALSFVRIEPYIVPKRSLTGESTERVDTRVLQVLFSFKPGSIPVYVGQQMDVFIEADPLATPSSISVPSGVSR